jgi:nucleoside 2-deoxyribosyltransferase
MLAYLAGAIEYAPDYGKGWRREITPFLRDLGHEVYDPAEDEKKSLSREEQENLRVWKYTELERFQIAVKKIVDYDLDIVSKADYLICYFDENGLKGGGTSGEVTFAFRNRIPVYMVTAMPPTEISGWILGCCTEIFRNFDGLKSFLVSANIGAERAKFHGSTDTR